MKKRTYRLPVCCRCEGLPELEYSTEARCRVLCPGCGTHTAWAPTRWQAYEDWEDMQN